MSPSIPSQFLWLSEDEVVSLMDMGEAITALEKGLLAEAQGQAQNMVKTHVAWNGSTLHAIGAAFPRAGFVGTKTWAHTEGGATPLVILFDSQTGNLKAVIEAFALGQLRTGAASGVATRCLAVRDAGEFAIIGTGKQALAQVAAVVAVRPIRSIRVFGRHKDRRSNFVSRTRQEFNLEVVEAASIREAVQGAQIITTATRATEPFLTADMISRGAHINSIGAIVATRAEVAEDVLARCDQVVVDSQPQARKLSRELMEYFGSGEGQWEQVASLANVVADRKERSATSDLTLFKSLGMGISDLSLGMELYRKALEQGVGRPLPQPEKAVPRLQTTT